MVRFISLLCGILATGATLAAVWPVRPRAAVTRAELVQAPSGWPVAETPPSPERLARGTKIYRTLCLACHMPDGRGIPQVTPPLAGSDYLLADPARSIRVVLHGLAGRITVNGAVYETPMPPLAGVLSDQDVADVLTYVFNAWGNRGPALDASRVAAARTPAAVATVFP